MSRAIWRATATGSCPSRSQGQRVLAALGSANPRSEEPFGAPLCTTFDGRALAIVRPTGGGEIEISVGADGCESVRATVTAADVASESPDRP
jgi:beta-galactosidase